MPFTNDPANNPTDRIRLYVGDFNADFEFLPDNVYQYLVTKYTYSGTLSEKGAAQEAAIYILGALTRYAREKAGDIEVFGNNYFTNYRTFLLELIKNPNVNFINAMPYAGGISKKDRHTEKNDHDRWGSEFAEGWKYADTFYYEEYFSPFDPDNNPFGIE